MKKPWSFKIPIWYLASVDTTDTICISSEGWVWEISDATRTRGKLIKKIYRKLGIHGLFNKQIGRLKGTEISRDRRPNVPCQKIWSRNKEAKSLLMKGWSMQGFGGHYKWIHKYPIEFQQDYTFLSDIHINLPFMVNKVIVRFHLQKKKPSSQRSNTFLMATKGVRKEGIEGRSSVYSPSSCQHSSGQKSRGNIA